MEIFIGLLIIAVGAFCQSSSYVPINKIRDWSWESYWIVQGVFAWLVFPLLGALLAVPAGESLFGMFAAHPKESLLTIFFGILWGVGGLTFGLSMRYLGVALGQSIALGTCAGLGTLLTPIFTGKTGDLTAPVIVGVVVTLGGFLTNACYCFYQNSRNKTWGDYKRKDLYVNNLLFCCLAGLLWYSQFFGLALGKGFLTGSAVLLAFSWCILQSLNVTFSNVWGIILKEWKGCSKKTIAILVAGLLVLIVSSFLPQLI